MDTVSYWRSFYIWFLGEYYGQVEAYDKETAIKVALATNSRLRDALDNVRASPFVADTHKHITATTGLPIYD